MSNCYDEMISRALIPQNGPNLTIIVIYRSFATDGKVIYNDQLDDFQI